MLTAFKAIKRPLVNYDAPIWSPIISNTQWEKLQVYQNAALRTPTGCLLTTNIDHLHSEIQILPVKTHTLMLAEQYLLSGHLSNQPNVNLVNEPLAKRCTYTKFYLFPKSPKTHPHRCTHLHLLLTLNITVLIVFSHC